MFMKYDLEERTLYFGLDIIKLCKSLPGEYINREIGRQLIRSAGSVGANYREGCESLGKEDKIMRFKISLKEAKETMFGLSF